MATAGALTGLLRPAAEAIAAEAERPQIAVTLPLAGQSAAAQHLAVPKQPAKARPGRQHRTQVKQQLPVPLLRARQLPVRAVAADTQPAAVMRTPGAASIPAANTSSVPHSASGGRAKAEEQTSSSVFAFGRLCNRLGALSA